MSGKVEIKLIDTRGDSALQHVTVDSGVPFMDALARLLPGTNLGGLTVRVNREEKPASYTFATNDRVTLSPAKISGAV